MYRVIIVDDDPMVRYINRSFVEENTAFHVVGEFSNSREALSFLNKHPIDLVVLDINMPGYSGLELLRDIRARRIGTDVILITAVNEAKTLTTALRLGAIDYLVKPFKAARFQQALERYTCYMQGLMSNVDLGLVEGCPWHDVRLPSGKGMKDMTLAQIVRLLEQSPEGNSVKEIAERVKLSRVTVRRYMKYLLDAEWVSSNINYNTGGRPSIIYHLALRE